MIQDIAPHQYHNEYRPQKPSTDSYLLCYKGREVLVCKTEENEIKFPTFAELEEYNEHIYEDYIYLFTIDEKRFYLGRDILYGPNFPYDFHNTEIFRSTHPKWLAFAGITGAQLNRWYSQHKFCGRCGSPMCHDEKERMVRCVSCGQMEYPKIMPAVIVGVTHGNRLLLSQYADRDFKKYALIAGFAEIGESLEETVKREVMEEVGLKVKNVRYYKSQPWSFSDTLLAGFYAELDGTEEITLDETELALAVWFEREEIPVEFNDISLTNEMIVAFKEGKV